MSRIVVCLVTVAVALALALVGEVEGRSYLEQALDEIAAIKSPINKVITHVGTSPCDAVKKLIGLTYENLKNETEPNLDLLTIELRESTVRVVYGIETAAEYIARMQVIHESECGLLLFVHGFFDNPDGESFENIRNSFPDSCVVLALDASKFLKWLYLHSTVYVELIGKKLGDVLATIYRRGIPPERMHIIGHSLGAHISGFAGKRFFKETGQKVGRITGLDPAGPCFSNIRHKYRLRHSDADFVDVIHTNAGVFGLDEPIGHADFYPNGGSQQPNCLLESCSHSRAWELFAASVKAPTGFPAYRCDTYSNFMDPQNKRCHEEIRLMGYYTDFEKSDHRGKYYLETTGMPPFAKGQASLEYEPRGVLSPWVRSGGMVVTGLFDAGRQLLG